MALYFFLISLGIFLFLTVYTAGYFLNRTKFEMEKRLERIQNLTASAEADDVLNRPLRERLLLPLWQQISKGIVRLAPAELRNKLARRLMQAGHPFGFGVQEFLAFQGAMLLGLPLLGLVFGWLLRLSSSQTGVLACCGMFLGLLFPTLVLTQGAVKRRKEIQRRLPDVLDLLTVSVEAGLGFDGALAKVVEKTKGVLADEFQRALQEIRMGKPRHEALRDLGSRNGVDDLVTFVGAIVQADQLGVSIGNVLRIQSDEMRRKRRQRAEEIAMKAPIKMMIPMVFFIFPTIFIIILGPAAIRILDVFK